MGCFGGDKRRFKKLEENKKNLNNNNNNDIAECSRTLKKNSSVKRFLENEQQHRDNKNIVGTNVKNSNNNIVVSRRLKARSNSLKRLLDNDHNQIGRNNNIASSSSRIKEEDQTQQHQAVTLEPETTTAGKEKEEIYSNKPLAKKFEDLNLRDNVRAKGKEAGHSNELKDTLEAKLTEAAKEASSSKDKLSLKLRDPNLKDDGRKSGKAAQHLPMLNELKGGSNATAEEEEETSHSDLFSQKFKDSNLKDSKRTHGKEARTFKYATLAKATGNFKSECFLGEGGFGKVYKGHLDEINQVVAIKQLDRHGSQGIREFVMEVLTLSLADHPNLVKLLGFCVDGDKRLLVYEYMPLGSLERYLHDLPPKQKPLDWNTRMKIASGAARGLEYLHDKIKPPVIYRDLKCANILLGDGYHPKLSDFGLAKVGPSGNKTHVSTRVMGTYGYCAPDYALTGQLNFKSDIYSFGVVLLELITGRKAFDRSKNGKEQSLVQWARPLFKDRKKFTLMADPLLEGQYPIRGLYQALAIAAMCIQEKASMRPAISDVVNALDFLASQTYNPSTRSEKQTGSIPSYSIAEKDSESLYFSLERNCHDEDDDNDDDEAKTAVANDDEAKNSFTDINREIKNL